MNSYAAMKAGTYPYRAGHKEETTSKAAAQKIERSGKAGSIRERLMALLETGEQHTVFTAGRALNVSQFSLRPRFSELFAQGKIRKVAMVESDNGVKVWIWGKAQ